MKGGGVMAQDLLTDAFAGLVLIVLLISNRLIENAGSKLARRFSTIVLASLAYLLVNSLSIFSEGKPELSGMTYFSNLLAFILVDCVLISFCFYLSALLESANARKTKIVHIPFFTCLLDIVTILVLAVVGKLFYIDAEGYYQEAELSSIPYIISAVVMLELLWVVLRNRKCFTTRQLVVVLIYLAFPLLPVILEMYLDLYSLTGISMTLSLLLIYVLVQVSAIERGKMRESVLEEISNTDLLTCLNNRRSYYRRLSELTENQPVGVAFCDLNRLKYTNDHFGHAAGDELIKKFAGFLLDRFRAGDVFRISGDEFIILIADITSESFVKRIEDFRWLIERNDYLSSIGYSYGRGRCVDKLVSDAEQAMYENKRQYHEALKDR